MTENSFTGNSGESKRPETIAIRLAEEKLRYEILAHAQYVDFCQHAGIKPNMFAALPKLYAQLDLTRAKRIGGGK